MQPDENKTTEGTQKSIPGGPETTNETGEGTDDVTAADTGVQNDPTEPSYEGSSDPVPEEGAGDGGTETEPNSGDDNDSGDSGDSGETAPEGSAGSETD